MDLAEQGGNYRDANFACGYCRMATLLGLTMGRDIPAPISSLVRGHTWAQGSAPRASVTIECINPENCRNDSPQGQQYPGLPRGVMPGQEPGLGQPDADLFALLAGGGAKAGATLAALGIKGLARIGARDAAAAGGRALIPAVDAVYAGATERLVAGYNVWGTAGRVGSTYNVNVLGLYATEGSQGLGALVGALRAEAAAAGASRISIQGLAIINEGLAGLSARAAARFGLQLERVNGNTIILSGGL
ncbi:MAG TPA: hypothetical protein VHC20_06550 [Candidatus Paceibacterota bacterium]|nr:hypothetical protein [Candidatus Paceibacterota bacterium]